MATIPQTGSRLSRSAADTGRALRTRRSYFDMSLLRDLDPLLIGATLAIAALGLLMIYSSTRERLRLEGVDELYFVKRQGIAIVVGLVLMTLLLAIDYRKLRDYSAFAYVVTVVGLLAVLSPLGSNARGSQAWFQLPGGFQLQPSELVKFGIIIALAGYANEHRGEMNPWRLTVTIALAAVPIGLVMLQPDFGTAMTLGLVVITMLAVAGVSVRHLVVLALLGVTFVIAVVNVGLLQQYQVDRLTSFVNQGADARNTTYNTDQSKNAIGNGGVTGRGFGNGSQTAGGFVPEQHTDFIFTAVGEEFGFLGGAVLLALFAIVVWRTWRAALFARDFFGTLVCVGVLAMFVFQIFENMGMTMGIMPVTGIPLPFMSYGGSSTIAGFACVALVANVSMRRFR
ncbi:MAG TPA: rod shape-determining protein RodA [Acidimicrobiia bacterium]|nr:rod shape-determining protein RodA [Acidimicrobiia bacterium]